MFLSNWLVLQIVAAGVTGAVEYPSAADFFMNFDSNNSLYFTGGSNNYVSNLILYKGETEYPVYNGTVSNIYISDPATYVSYIQLCNETYVTNTVDVQTVVNPEGTFPDTATAVIPGYGTSSSWSQGSMGSYIDFNGDGTRMVVGMGLYNSNQGRAAVYHLEDGTWVQKVDLAPTSNSTRFGDSVLMNEDGTRIAVNYYENNTIKIYEYTNGAWPTSPTTSISGTFSNGDMDWNNDGTVLGVAHRGGNKAYIYTRDSGTGNWSLTKTWLDTIGDENSIAINGAGTRVILGCNRSGGSTNNWVSSIYEANYDSGTSTWSSLTEVGTYSHTGNTDWPARLRMNNDGTRLVAIGQAGGASDTNIWHRQSGTSWTKTFDISGRCSIYSRGSGSISYDGTMVLTGDNYYNSSQGRAYLYEYSGGSWSLTKTYENPKITPVTNDGWGYGTAITKLKDRIAIGMAGDDTYGSEYGSLYVYDLGYSYPTLTQDNYNKLTLNSLTPTAGRITFGSNTYDTGTVTNFYVSEPGTYEVSARSTDAYAIVKKTVAAPVTIPPVITNSASGFLVFHHDNFDNVYSDGTVETAAINGHVYANTPLLTYNWGKLSVITLTSSNTTYSWTPNQTPVKFDALIVAGGGAGGSDRAGGGGAGGLVYLQNYVVLGTQTIVVGNGGAQSTIVEDRGDNGSDTMAFGFTAVGGGGGGGYGQQAAAATNIFGNSGGSGGGGAGVVSGSTGGDSTQNTYNGKGFGNTGGTSTAYSGSGGGGGAGAPGQDGSGHNAGDGGDGKYYPPSTFGTIYGDSGWFAGGGGGGYDNRSSGSIGYGGLGGGGSGGNNGLGSVSTNVYPTPGTPHTGGGGGGSGCDETNTAYLGQAGGSGIVLIAKQRPITDPFLLYDGYNKLTIESAEVNSTLRYESNTYDIGSASTIIIQDPGRYEIATTDNENFLSLNSNVTDTSVTQVGVYDYSQAQSTEQKITASDAASGDRFGVSVAVDGDYAFVGARNGEVTTSDSGSVYVFVRNRTTREWFYQQELTASDGATGDNFGYWVSISGDYAIIGSHGDDDAGSGSGSAYIFKRDTTTGSWSQQTKLTASDAATGDSFGWGAVISGDYAIVGAQFKDTNTGAAYIFKYDATYPPDDLPPVDSVGTGFNYKRYTSLDTSTHYVYKMWRNSANDWRTPSPASANTIKVLKTDSTDWSDNDTTDNNPTYIDTTTYSGKVSLGQSGPTENYRFSVPTFGGWSQQQKIEASDKASSDFFGESVSLSGDYAIVGAYGDDTYTGAAYIYTRNASTGVWGDEQKIEASDKASNDQFGYFVSLSGDYAIVGAPFEDPGGTDGAGAAYIYTRNTSTGVWGDEQKIQASDKAAGDYFGTSVSLSGDYAIVGAYGKDTGTGGAYIFKRDGTTWSEIKSLTAGDRASGDQFGFSTAIDGSVIFVGAKEKNSLTGAAYIYTAENLSSTLAYDGLNTLVLSNVSTGSYNTFLEGSNVLACATDLTTYPVPKSGTTGTFTYSARTKSDSVYAFTNDVSITDYYKTYQYPPIDGTTSSLTTSTTADTWNTWTISGAANGNGQYQAKWSVATDNIPYNTFRNNVGSTNYVQTALNPTYPIDITLELPSAKTIRKYRMFPLDHVNPYGPDTDATSGTSVNPTLPGNGGGDATKRPKSWILYGYDTQNGWESLDTVTDKPISIYGDVYSIDTPGSYQQYKLSVTANNGGNKLLFGDIQLWGDA